MEFTEVRRTGNSNGEARVKMKSEAPIRPAPSDTQKPVQTDDWFATFTLLDFSGATGASQLRRVAATISKLWQLTLRSVSDRSKSRVVGM